MNVRSGTGQFRIPDHHPIAAKSARRAEAIDAHVGSRIRLRRSELKLSQYELADRLGIAFQQVQKYEVGRNRVSASRLVDIAKALDVKPSYFFQGATRSSGKLTHGTLTSASLQTIVKDKSILRLLRTISQIENEGIRDRAAAVVKMLATQ